MGFLTGVLGFRRKVALVLVWFSFCGSSFVGGLLLKRSLVAAPRRDFAYIFGLRKRTYFRRFFKLVLGRFFIGFGGLLGAHFGFFFNVFSMKKSTTFWDRFSEAFGRVSGTPDPPKLSSRVYETLIFEKSPFSFWYRFLLNFGLQKPPKMDPKSTRKSIKTSMQFYIEKRTTFYRKRESRWDPQGVPKREFWRSLEVSFSRPLQGTQNGCKMGPKWSQNRSKLELKIS